MKGRCVSIASSSVFVVHALYLPVGLMVVTRGEFQTSTQELKEATPETRGELGVTIRKQDLGQTLRSKHMRDKELGHLFGGHTLQSNRRAKDLFGEHVRENHNCIVALLRHFQGYQVESHRLPSSVGRLERCVNAAVACHIFVQGQPKTWQQRLSM